MDKKTATAIVVSANPDANETVVSTLLDSSKGVGVDNVVMYRPYIVAARTLSINPPNSNLKKADTLEWFDWTKRVEELMALQVADDVAITDIPPGWLATITDLIPMVAMVSDNADRL